MSVQINCCPVKGRDRFRRPHQRARLAGVQLPACTQGDCWPLLTLTLCPDLAWSMLGALAEVTGDWTSSCVAGLGLMPWRFADMSVLDLGRARSGAWVWQWFLSSCMSQLTGNEILGSLFPEALRWAEFLLWLQEVLDFICSSVWSQEEALSGPKLLSPLCAGSLCNINVLEKLQFCNKARKI